MNATTKMPDRFDLDFTVPSGNAANAAALWAESSEDQRREVIAGAAALQKNGYCINIVRPASNVTPIAPGARHCILCIDDELPLLRVLARKLSDDGYAVCMASDRQTIVAELQKLPPPNLILLDVGLPGISGFEVLRTMRQHPVLSAVPVIMLTGHVEPEDVLRGMNCGADGYVSKPFRFDALADAIKTVLGIH